MKRPLAILTLSLALASCGPTAVDHGKAFYAAHPDERAKTLAQCHDDPGTEAAKPDCVNAVQAAADAEHQRVFHTPPEKPRGVTDAGHL